MRTPYINNSGFITSATGWNTYTPKSQKRPIKVRPVSILRWLLRPRIRKMFGSLYRMCRIEYLHQRTPTRTHLMFIIAKLMLWRNEWLEQKAQEYYTNKAQDESL